jgi:methionine sulfoxide reductase heme-binding subunit
MLEDVLLVGIGVGLGGILGLLLLAVLLFGRPTAAGLAGGIWQTLQSGLPWGLGQVVEQQASLLGLTFAADTKAYWYMARAGGLMSYALLWAVTAWGLVLSSKMAKGVLAGSFVMGIHQFLALLALGFSTLHGLVLLGDKYIGFNLWDVFFPFAASYKPFWVGLGQVSFYLFIVLIVSFNARRFIGFKTWRAIHISSFAAYAMVVMHALAIGSDAKTPAVRVMYLVTGGIIIFLIYYRLFTLGKKRPESR